MGMSIQVKIIGGFIVGLLFGGLALILTDGIIEGNNSGFGRLMVLASIIIFVAMVFVPKSWYR